jgi:hypothetical protein
VFHKWRLWTCFLVGKNRPFILGYFNSCIET